MKKFTKQELREQLGMTEENVKTIMDAQRKFPELLTTDLKEGFPINGELLCNELEVKSNFNDWLLRKTKGKEGKLIKYRCIEDTDFICISEKSETQRKDGQKGLSVKNVIKLSLHTAKKIAMRQNNEQGDLVCDYFILLEEAIKDKIEWLQVREPEAKGYNDMKVYINKWCESKGFDNSDDSLTKREANMLNIALTGKSAMELRDYIGYRDVQTREHLTIEKNKALSELQLINSSLLMANLDFKARKQIIEDTCKNKYPHLKII